MWRGLLGYLSSLPLFALFRWPQESVTVSYEVVTGVIYTDGTTLLYNQARWLLCQGRLGVRSCIDMLPRLNFGGPLLPISQASLGVERRSRHFPDDSRASSLSRPITSRSDITLRTQDTIDKSSFLLRPFDGSPPPVPAPRPAGLWRTTLEKKNAAQEAFPSPEQGSARTNSAGLLAVWVKDQLVLLNRWGRRLPYLLLHALIILMSSNACTRAPRNVDDS